MIKCRIIPELVEIWSAYDTAAENFPDTLEPDSVEGRREIISSALNYIKDNGVVPSQQSLGMLQNELIRYDRDNYEGLFGFATNEKETRDLIEQNWDIVSIDEDAKNIAPEANDFPQAPIPSISEGLDSIFDNINDQSRFVRHFQNELTRFAFVNYNLNKLISTNRDLNDSIRMYKNQIFQELAKEIGSPVTQMYAGREFQLEAYNNLIRDARIYFFEDVKDGVFVSTDQDRINAYNKYVMLTNFDGFLLRYSKNIIQVARGFVGGHIDPKAGYKYTFNLGKHIKQDYNNELQDINEHVNGAVQMFVNSIPMVDEHNNPTGQYVEFKTFNSLTRIFRNISENNPGITREIRNNPREAIKEIINIAYNNSKTYFKGNDATLYPTFRSVRRAVFDITNPSSLASLESSITSPDQMNLFSMVLNHINKTSPVSYLQYKYNPETGKYVVSYLDSEAISQKRTDLEKHLMIQSTYDNFFDIFSKHSIAPVEDADGVVSNITFNIGGAHYNYNLSNKALTKNGTIVQDYLSELLSNRSGWGQFFSDVMRKPIDATFIETATEVNDAEDLKGFLNVAMATIVNADAKDAAVKAGETLKDVVSTRYSRIVPEDSKASTYYDRRLDSLRIGGVLDGLRGLIALSRTIAANNRDTTKSYVKNADGNNLPKYRLTSAGNDDAYILNDIRSAANFNPKNPMNSNLFISTDGLLTGTALKTDFTNSEGTSKNIFKMQANELLYSQFVFDYLQTRDKNSANRQSNELAGIVAIQPTTYSDKSNIWVKLVDLYKTLSFKDIYGNNLFEGKSLSDLTVNEINQLRFSTLHGMYQGLANQLVEDYKLLFTASNGVFVNELGEYDETDYKQLSPEVRALMEKRTQYIGDDGSYEYYDFKEDLTVEDFIPLLSKLDTDTIHNAVYMLQSQGIDITVLPEVHYIQTKKGLAFNTTLLENIRNYSLKNKDNQSTLDNISDSYWTKKREEDKLYALTLKMSDVKFDLYDEFGKEITTLTENIDRTASQKDFVDRLTPKAKQELYNKLHIESDEKATYENIWIDNRTQRLNNYYILKKNGSKYDIVEDVDFMKVAGNTDYEVVLNPDLDLYKSIDNLVSDNYNAATIGLPFLHPAKKAAVTNDASLIDKINEEAARTTAMYKRGVVVGATIHPFIKGKITGIPDTYKLAVIEDLKTPVFNVQGDDDGATQFDGGIFLNPMIARYEQNSLEEIEMSPIHRKPLGYFSLSNYLSSGLLKCATFAVTNEYLRAAQTGDVIGNSLLKQMLDVQWDIPNLDITVDRNGRKISYNGQMYRDINTLKYWSINNIEKLNKIGYDENGNLDNTYEITRTQIDKNGQALKRDGSIITEKIKVRIDTNYDLWMALGGEFSVSRDGKTLKESESSLDKLTEVGNQVAFNRNNIDDIPLIQEARRHGARIDIYPTGFDEDVSQNTYYQPMKFSGIAYLATAGAVKNGMANVNPGRLFKNGYNPNIQALEDSDRVIYGHPAIGKTYAKARHDSFLSFDDDYGNAIKGFIDKRLKEGQTRQDYKREAPEEYRQFLLGLYETAKARANEEGKRLFFSDSILLQALDETGRLEEIDKALSMNPDEFVDRSRNRGEVDDANTKDWKNKIDLYLNKIPDRIVNVGRNYLLDILDNTRKKHQRSQLTYINIKPDFIGIQLNAEHSVDEAEVSEMTQVISALEQMSTSHGMANQVYEDIGRVIARGLREYNFDANSEEDKTRVYKILGRDLLRTFSTGDKDRLGLAGAYMELVKKDILSDKSLQDMAYKIPFDDNNIFGVFTNGFTNGINRDIIKRKYAGLQAILNPSHDIVTVYDGPDGGILKYSDILGRVNTPAERDAIFRKMDTEVEIGEIRAGDWISIQGGEPVKVLNYRSKVPGTIGIIDLKDMRLNGILSVKRLGSKGRNLRSANHVIKLVDGSSSNGFTTFDAYDLDTSRLSWDLKEKNWADNVKNNPTQLQAWNEIVQRIQDKYGRTITFNTDKGEINGYLRDLITDDLAEIAQGRYRIPVAYRSGENIFAQVAEDRFDANELAIGKNTASKFGLKIGDSLSEIETTGPLFFERRQREILNTDIGSNNYDMYFVKNNKQHLHVMLSNNPASKARIDSLIKDGIMVEDKGVEKTTVNGKNYVIVDGQIGYRIDDDSKFYNYITSAGESRQVLVTSDVDTLRGIDKSKLYSNAVYRYSSGNIATLFPLQINSMFTSLEDKAILEEWYDALKEAETEQDKYDIANEVNEQTALNLERRIKKSAQDTFTSWQEALKFIVARIPSQSMQSFMNMKVAMFTESETNICYVPVEQIWYQGSDFDIDKAFMLGASISNQGIYYNWSPLFNFNSQELLSISHDLPFPTGYKYFLDNEVGFPLEGDYSNLLGKTYDEITHDPVLFRSLVNLMREVSKFPPSGNANMVKIAGLDEELIDLIGIHNEYELGEADYQEAIKNKVFNALWRIGADVKNVVSATSPISMGPAQDAAAASTSGQFSKLVSNENPGARVILQYQNSIGKDGIGVYATGIKVFSILLNYYNEKLSKATEDNLNRYTFYNENSENKGTIEVYDNEGNKHIIQQSPTLPNVKVDPTTNPALLSLAEAIIKRGFQEDVFLTDSVLLSAATDNAKELILEKINAGPDLASVYIYLFATGVDFKTASDFMTTRAVTMAQNKAKTNILYIDGKRNNLDRAVKYYTELADPDSYIPQIYQQSIIDWGNDTLAKLSNDPEIGAELKEIMKTETKFYNILNKITNQKVLDAILDYAYNSNTPLKIYKKELAKKKSRAELELEWEGALEAEEDWMQSEDSEDFRVYNTGENKAEQLRYIFSRYVNELKRRRTELNTLTDGDLHNMKVLLELKQKSDELTRLGRLGSLNQGIKTKLMDKIKYINQIESFVNRKFTSFNKENELSPDDEGYITPNFNLIEFIQNPEYKQEMIDAYEQAKDTFNILDIITSVPHFNEMLNAMAVDDKLLGFYASKYTLTKNLAMSALHAKAIGQLTPKDMGEINRFVSDVTIVKFLKTELANKISLSPGSKMYNSLGKVVPVATSGKIIDFANVYDRATFKMWFEQEFIPNMKAMNPKNKFIQALTSTYFKNSFQDYNFLYKLPIDLGNLEQESNEIAYSNYLKAFDEIKYTRPLPDVNMTTGDLFFLYNLLVSKNAFGDNTLTKIFENSLSMKTKNDEVEVRNSLLLKFMDFEAKQNPNLNEGTNGLVEGEDYKLDDLYVRLIKYNEPNGTRFTKEYDNDAGKIVIKESNYGEKSTLDLFTDNNTMLLPFLTKGFTRLATETKNDLISKLVNLISNNKAEIKLTCDE